MIPIHYHASHEQFSPRELLELAADAERAGFDGIASSDHLAPWTPRRGVAASAWVWLSAAMAATTVPFGVVTTPGYRYPLPVLAQAIASLAEMHPGRLAVSLGSGEALNEALAGHWPGKDERNARLRDHVELLDELLHDRVDAGDPRRLWLPPAVPPPLSVAAVTRETAAWIGGWWGALTTIGDTVPRTRERVDAFRQAHGARGRVTIKIQISVASTREEAVAAAHAEWRAALLGPELLTELRTPAEFERAAADIAPGEAAESIAPVTSAAGLGELLDAYAALDPELLVVHDVAPEQRVIPLLAELRRDGGPR